MLASHTEEDDIEEFSMDTSADAPEKRDGKARSSR